MSDSLRAALLMNISRPVGLLGSLIALALKNSTSNFAFQSKNESSVTLVPSSFRWNELELCHQFATVGIWMANYFDIQITEMCLNLEWFGFQMPSSVQLSDHHLVNRPVFRTPFEYWSVIQMPSTMVQGIWIFYLSQMVQKTKMREKTHQ